jgi:hypothetical protein
LVVALTCGAVLRTLNLFQTLGTLSLLQTLRALDLLYTLGTLSLLQTLRALDLLYTLGTLSLLLTFRALDLFNMFVVLAPFHTFCVSLHTVPLDMVSLLLIDRSNNV